MSLVKQLNKLNEGLLKSKIKKIPRCSEHSLYLYSNGLNEYGEVIATCKLGCLEFWKEKEFYKN